MKVTKIVISAVVFVLYIVSYFLEELRIETIYLRNISLLILIGLIAVFILNAITNKLILFYQLNGIKETIIHGLKIGLFTIVILITSTLQYNLIQYNNIPKSKGCSFYDTYGNAIYENLYNTGCADINYVSKTDNYLEFEVTESYEKVMSSFRFNQDEEQTYNDVVLRAETLVLTKIHYDQEHRIISSEIIRTNIYNTVATGRSHSYYGTSHTVTTNTYGENFEQVIRTGFVSEERNEADVFELKHAPLSDIEYREIRYYRVNRQDNSFEIYKDYTEEDVLKTELITTVYLEEDGYTLLNTYDFIDHEYTQRYQWNQNQVQIFHVNEIEEEITTHFKTYQKHKEYGYILHSIIPNTGNYDFFFIETRDRNYYVEELNSGNYHKTNYYEFHTSEYGVYVEKLEFNEISLYEYLFEKEQYDSIHNIEGEYKGSYINRPGTSIFDIEYETDDMIFVKPIYID